MPINALIIVMIAHALRKSEFPMVTVLKKEITATIAPGPTSSGRVSGTRVGSALGLHSFLLCALLCVSPEVMTKPMCASKNPPAIENAAIDIPNSFKSCEPTIAVMVSPIQVYIIIFKAFFLAVLLSMCCIMETNLLLKILMLLT